MGTNIANIKVSQCDNALYSKQHLNNIWSSIYDNLSNTKAELKKSVAYKKGMYLLNVPSL